jgi:hypothetical protein
MAISPTHKTRQVQQRYWILEGSAGAVSSIVRRYVRENTESCRLEKHTQAQGQASEWLELYHVPE